MITLAEVILSQKLLFVFHCFTNKMVLFGSLKAKQLFLFFKDYFDKSICSFQRLAGQKKTIQVRSSSRLCSVQALGSIQRDRFMQTSLSEVCSMYCKK